MFFYIGIGVVVHTILFYIVTAMEKEQEMELALKEKKMLVLSCALSPEDVNIIKTSETEGEIFSLLHKKIH